MPKHIPVYGLLILLAACGGDDANDSSIYNSASLGSGMNDAPDDSAEASDTVSTGDGDPTTSTGDGDPTTSTGDGDPTTTTTGDGDGDGDPTTDASSCGNGIIDPGEECDGANLGGSSCAAHGFDGGVLACDPVICVFDTSGCTDDPADNCDSNCNGCACPSNACTMCCALKGKVDTCGGGSCGCF